MGRSWIRLKILLLQEVLNINMANRKNAATDELTYLAPPPSISELTGTDHRGESNWQKLKRKSKENPFIPFGFPVTLFALCNGVYQGLWVGNADKSQYMMRLRVGAQCSVLLAFFAGIVQAKKQAEARKTALGQSDAALTDP